ncbi:Ger(x)C family spore germination protein [Bacillus infantis]|uniref:Ger(x)C family spore germination protein n=1 Tax=Bacillus infantis TaxID=324767 RepID=UPI001CD5F01E|nr:Ger(x)C family spore germination protein [Bacillus infantis]MCA1039940.1 Ger(x)C family spore germination protein [Bacillus infantis]
MKIVCSLLIALGLLLPAAGCVKTKQLERLGLITAIGYDEKGDIIEGTVVLHTFESKEENVTQIITASGNTSKGIRQKQNIKTSHNLVSGQLRVAVYSEETAKKGLLQLVDTLNRDATIGNLVYLTVSKGKAKDLLKKAGQKEKTNLGTYLYNLIKQNIKDELILSPTLHEFNHSYFDPGKDPVLPVLKLEEDKVIIAGMAAFKDDLLAGELEIEKLFYLKTLEDNYESGNLELEIPKERLKEYILPASSETEEQKEEPLFITIDDIVSTKKIRLKDREKVQFSIDIKLKSRILEVSRDMDLGNPKVIKAVEKETAKKVKQETETMLKQLQEMESDPVGFGNIYSAHLDRGKSITRDEWRNIYKKAKFDVHVENTIARTGVID